MANATTGEIACFGGAIPFYSFTVNHGITYTKGTTIHLEETYTAHENISTNPATIQYRVVYNGNTYDSPVLPFGEQNAAECAPHGLWGMLNDGRVGGYFQPRANSAASLTATWSNITFAKCQTEVAASFHPSTLNLSSKGRWVTVVLTPAPPVTPADLDVSSILLNGAVHVDPAAPVSISGGDLTVKFSRDEVSALLAGGSFNATITISGSVGKDCFEATDVVKVKNAKLAAPVAGSVVAPGLGVDLSWTPVDGVQTVSVTRTLDNGATWTVDADGVPNSGTYHWIVPNVSSTQSRIAVEQMISLGAAGTVPEVEIAESGTFTISGSTVGVGDSPVSFSLGRIAPNPSSSRFDVAFSLPLAAPASLSVYDVSGRRVADRSVGGVGFHTVSIGDREALRPGLYMVRLSQQTKSLTTSVLILP
jgi:hypothetical protein